MYPIGRPVMPMVYISVGESESLTTFGGKSSTVESGGEHTLRGGLVVVGYLPPSCCSGAMEPGMGTGCEMSGGGGHLPGECETC